jgi:hypothetical protein
MFSYLKFRNVFAIIALVFISSFISQTFSIKVNLRGDEDDLLRRILKDQYTDFVVELGENIKDDKFREAIRRLGESNKVKAKNIAARVKRLIPTQNEIDVDKSLKFPLTSVDSARLILYCNEPLKIAGNSIVTSGRGKYIVDGHHRWSQVYSLNYKCKLASVDLTDIKGPFNALKATQLGIVAGKDPNGNDITSIPVQRVQGRNLLTISHDDLISYVEAKITKEVLEVFSEYDENLDSAAKVGEFIWKNVSRMQENNQPVHGAPGRGYMPQTDTSPQWVNYAVNTERVLREVN